MQKKLILLLLLPMAFQLNAMQTDSKNIQTADHNSQAADHNSQAADHNSEVVDHADVHIQETKPQLSVIPDSQPNLCTRIIRRGIALLKAIGIFPQSFVGNKRLVNIKPELDIILPFNKDTFDSNTAQCPVQCPVIFQRASHLLHTAGLLPWLYPGKRPLDTAKSLDMVLGKSTKTSIL